MSEIKKRTFGHTAAALIVFESTAAQRACAWDDADCMDDIQYAEEADLKALRHVQVAYHKDTRDINSLESCMRMDLDSLRRLAKGSAPAAPDANALEGGDAPDDTEASDDTDSPAPR